MISIVLPCFNEEANVGHIYSDIVREIGGTDEYEIIFVDDGSEDRTFEEILALSEKDAGVSGIRLSRNFGQQAALLAGLKEATGDYVVMMDADGQHPPSLLPRLIATIREGYDIVNTKRTDRQGETYRRRISARMFYRVIRFLSDTDLEKTLVDYRIMNRKALDAFLQLGESNRFNRGLISWMGFRQTQVEFKAPERMAGKSNYNFRNLKHLALDGITSFSTKPLRISLYLGMIVIIFGILYSVYAVFNYFFGHTNPGWTSLLISTFIIGGTQLFILGIIGEYLGRVFNESKKRPQYFISERTK